MQYLSVLGAAMQEGVLIRGVCAHAQRVNKCQKSGAYESVQAPGKFSVPAGILLGFCVSEVSITATGGKGLETFPRCLPALHYIPEARGCLLTDADPCFQGR